MFYNKKSIKICKFLNKNLYHLMPFKHFITLILLSMIFIMTETK